jgi:hypothetical protein
MRQLGDGMNGSGIDPGASRRIDAHNFLHLNQLLLLLLLYYLVLMLIQLLLLLLLLLFLWIGNHYLRVARIVGVDVGGGHFVRLRRRRPYHVVFSVVSVVVVGKRTAGCSKEGERSNGTALCCQK